MKQFPKCLPCYLNAAVNAMEKAGHDEKRQQELLRQLAPFLSELPDSGTPCENASYLLRRLYDMTGEYDPFKKEKDDCNKLAFEYLPKLESMLEASEDRLYAALKLAAAGNVIDLAIFDTIDLEPALRHCAENDFARDDYAAFRSKLQECSSILVVGDNAGEIVFDTLLVKELKSLGKQVVYMVKEGPIVNDATMEDARFCGMDKLCSCVTTGRADMGYSFKLCPEDKNELIRGSDLIISKGQANYEGFDEADFLAGKLFFLFKVKCAAISSHARAPLGETVFFVKQ